MNGEWYSLYNITLVEHEASTFRESIGEYFCEVRYKYMSFVLFMKKNNEAKIFQKVFCGFGLSSTMTRMRMDRISYAK